MFQNKMTESLSEENENKSQNDPASNAISGSLVSCQHIVNMKKKFNIFNNYKKLYKIFILSINPNHKKLKATLWNCSHWSCRDQCFPSRLHTCLFCQFYGCFSRKHIHQHFEDSGHNIAMDINYGNLYCFSCDNYIFDEEFESISYQLRRKAATVRRNNGQQLAYNWDPCLRDDHIFQRFSSLQFKAHKEYSGLRGLINLGSTCFMNCIIQALVHTQPLRDYFLGGDSHKCTKEACLPCEMSSLVQEFYSGKKTPHIPYKLLHLVWTDAKHLAGYEQQDAHEFLVSTLELMHRHSSSEEIKNSKCRCIIDKVFTGSLQSDLVCKTCNGVSSVVDPTWDFSLNLVNNFHKENGKNLNNTNSENIKEPLTLYDCLELFTQTEHLDSTSKIKCNKCGSYQESTKRLTLKTLPIIVSFHLKRFEQKNKLNKKISTFVSFPTSIDMTPFTTTEIDQNESNNNAIKKFKKDNRYSLFAVVNHSGTLETGHYTVFIKSNNYWFKCDDHFVYRATESEVLNSEGYLLFYQKDHYEYVN